MRVKNTELRARQLGPAAFLLSRGRRSERREQSWPIERQSDHFDLGHVLNCAVTDTIEPEAIGALSVHHAGLWECNLETGQLIWSGGVYDIFGLERGRPVTRELALSLYAADSREILEQLRAAAIRDCRGFTVDVEIHPAAPAEPRWIRIIAAPVIEEGSVKRLHGVKLLI